MRYENYKKAFSQLTHTFITIIITLFALRVTMLKYATHTLLNRSPLASAS